MLQNGLYWSFYCCSSIWIFVQIVKIRCNHHFEQFTSARERLPEPASTPQTVSKLSPPTHPEQTPTPPGRLKLHLPVPLREKKESNKSSRQLFFSSIIYHSASESKKSQKNRFCVGGSKPRTLVVSEIVFRCLYMSLHLFDMCNSLPSSMLPFSLFSNIYIKASKKVY